MEYTITDDDIDNACSQLGISRDDLMQLLSIDRASCITAGLLALRKYDFEAFWIAYKRKGNKKAAREAWNKMSAAKQAKAMEHAPKYIASRELHFCKDAERYLRMEVYNDEIITAGVNTVAGVIEYRDSLAAALGL